MYVDDGVRNSMDVAALRSRRTRASFMARFPGTVVPPIVRFKGRSDEGGAGCVGFMRDETQ